MQPKVKKKEFFTDVDLKKDGHFSGRVSTVTSPGDFYVQKVSIFLVTHNNYIMSNRYETKLSMKTRVTVYFFVNSLVVTVFFAFGLINRPYINFYTRIIDHLQFCICYAHFFKKSYMK